MAGQGLSVYDAYRNRNRNRQASTQPYEGQAL